MLLEISLIAVGIPGGWLLRRQKTAQKIVSNVLTWTVRLLLFFLGLTLGADSVLLAQIKQLGLQALLISVFSIAGCLPFARMLAGYLHLEGPPEAITLSKKAKADRASIKSALLVLVFFCCGMLAGMGGAPIWLARPTLIYPALIQMDISLCLLYVMLFCAGMGIGFDLKALGIIRELKGRILLVPLGVAVGAMIGSTMAWFILRILGFGAELPDSLAVGAGFGYYSLATVIITTLGSPVLGSVALLSNMIRELIALTLAPLLVELFGRLGPVMAGGAASMDTCLPVIAQNCGERYAILAVFSGLTLTLLVPVLVPALLALKC